MMDGDEDDILRSIYDYVCRLFYIYDYKELKALENYYFNINKK